MKIRKIGLYCSVSELKLREMHSMLACSSLAGYYWHLNLEFCYVD